MRRPLRIAIIALAGVVGVVLLALAVIALTVDPNRFKPEIVRLVQEKKQRTLTIEGDIHLKLFPRLGIDLGRTRLSERNAPGEFAGVESLQLYVAWLPLLRKELVVDRIAVQGARARLVRHADGTTNFDDLLSKEEAGPLKFDIHAVEVSGSALSFEDRLAGRTVELRDLRLKTSRIREGLPTNVAGGFRLAADAPRAALEVAVKSGLLFSTAEKRYAVNGLDLKMKGEAAGMTDLALSLSGGAEARLANPGSPVVSLEDFKLDLKGRRGADGLDVTLHLPHMLLAPDKAEGGKATLSARVERPSGPASVALTLSDLSGSARQLRVSRLTLELDVRQGETALRGRFASPLAANPEARTLELGQLAGDLDLVHPRLAKGGVKLGLDGRARADFAQKQASMEVRARLDDSRVDARLGLASFDPARFTFDIAIDRLDVDRYLSSGPRSSAAEPETRIDLSSLRTLDASGRLRIGELRVANVRSSNVQLELRAGGGRIELNPFSASLYQGGVRGSVSATTTARPQLRLRQTLSNVSIGPLLRDLADKDLLEGRGNLSLDLVSQGETASALRKGLAGTASLHLTDGAIKGVNIAAMLRRAQAALTGGLQTQAASRTEQTDFTELKASFRLRDGVAHNDDLSVKSPLLRLSGAGDLDIGNGAMDYVLRASVVGTLEGQGGRELSQLRGVTVPVRVHGAFSDLKYSLDPQALVTESARARLEQKKQEVQEKAKEQLLRGLFGR